MGTTGKSTFKTLAAVNVKDRLEKKVYLRDFKLSSIQKFAFDGKIYLVG